MTNEQKAEQPVPADEPTCLGAGDLVRIRDTARAVFHGRDQVAFDVIEWYHASLLGEVAALAASPQAAPVAEETVYETIIHWDEGGGKRSRRELARRIVALYLAPQAAQAKAETQPVAWTLQETIDKRETTCSARLWFTDPVNSAWVPLYTAPIAQPAAQPVPADLAERIEAAREASLDDDHRACQAILTECLKLLAFGKAAPVSQPKPAFWVYEWINPSDGRVHRSLSYTDEYQMGRMPDRAIPVPLMDEWVEWMRTAQAKAKPEPLTDEQIASVWRAECSVDGRTTTADLVRAFARAIERAHGIAITKEAT